MATPLSSSHECLIEITTDISCIDLERVHEWLARKSLWAGQMPRAVFDRAVRGSLCFGAIKQGATVGFARVISDQATFCYVSDVFVDPAQRGTGISKIMMAAVMAHPELQDLRLWCLRRLTHMACTPVTASSPLRHLTGIWNGAMRRSISAWRMLLRGRLREIQRALRCRAESGASLPFSPCTASARHRATG